MVQIDIPAAFIASQLFLDLGRKAVKADAREPQPSKLYYRFLSRSLLFAGAAIAPAGIYLLAGWPGWEQIYWTERVENVIFDWRNALIPPLFIMAIVGAGYLGHVLGYRWLTRRKESLLRPVYLSVLAAVTLLVLFNYPAFLLIGTYREYHFNRGSMLPAWRNPHGFISGWLVCMGYFVACFIWAVVSVRRDARRQELMAAAGQ